MYIVAFFGWFVAVCRFGFVIHVTKYLKLLETLLFNLFFFCNSKHQVNQKPLFFLFSKTEISEADLQRPEQLLYC
ncbi:hypothetical protein L6452_28839 [Arctium lappa]|uniref:Uncharacterized protein n=1 Tax=Arctium lappa TaxID=4217 RepID=A0ACB8ZZE4_ARCLA|nr:hypothetical protein L6452_28839 [Arctium lappa]